MEGDLSAIPIADVMELLHDGRRTGRLELKVGELPLTLRLVGGEVVGGGIWDWEGLEAISTFPLRAHEGHFEFVNEPQTGTPLMGFKAFMGEWARLNDEWSRFHRLLDSPSRVVESPRPVEPFAVLVGGKSVRAAAKAWGVPLIVAAERAWRGLHEGDLVPLRKYAWFALRIRHPSARRTQASSLTRPEDRITVALDGTRNLGEIIQSGGLELGAVRRYLVGALLSGEIQPPGRGWLLRDLLWELEAERRITSAT